MNFINTGLKGAVLIEPRVFGDDRGYFYESYNEAEFKKAGISAHFVQDNQSKSCYGVIRGLHAQSGEHSQAKLVRVIEGTVLDVIVDIRENSETFGKHHAVELSAENKRSLYIPKGFLHGFSVLSENATFIYKCDSLYNKASEIGVRFNDEKLGIDWKIPQDKIIVSDKDKILGGIDNVARYRG